MANDRWFTISMLLSKAALPASELPVWNHTARADLGILSQISELKLVEAPYKTSIEDAVEAWDGCGPIRGLDGIACALLHTRIFAVQGYVMSLSIPFSERCEKVFRAPELSDLEVVKFLLTEWWSLHGYLQALITKECRF